MKPFTFSRSLRTVAFLILLATPFSCKKGSSGPVTTIYVAGTINTSGGPVPGYWKNGQLVQLKSNEQFGEVSGMTTQGSDVYIAGLSSNMLNTSLADARIIYWKNGVATYLPDNNKAGLATGIAVSDSNVYVSGYSYDLTYSSTDEPAPVYWKNDLIDSLSISGGQAQTIAVAVQGSDVYIAASSPGLGGNTVAEYWKNGVMDSLGEGAPTAIALSGSDVYVVGSAHNNNPEFVAVCWKNGQQIPLQFTDQTYYPCGANAVAVSGSDVYVAGNTLDKNGSGASLATLWANGVPVQLGYGTASAICISNGDVYVAGLLYKGQGTFLPAYWKNGALVTLPGSGNPAGIAVVAP